MNIQKGFTLVELMIVISIIGILSSIAIPGLQTYLTRAHVTEGMILASDLRTRAGEFFLTNGSFPANAQHLGINTPITGISVREITINTSKITITFTTKVRSGNTLFLQARIENSTILWDCHGGTLAKKYRPPNCRE